MIINQSIKVKYKAFDQLHEDIFPSSYTIGELSNYLRLICHKFIIVSMQPTTKKPTI